MTGAGEAMALILRLVFGSSAERRGRYWTSTWAGYLLTAVCVPALVGAVAGPLMMAGAPAHIKGNDHPGSFVAAVDFIWISYSVHTVVT